MGIRTDICDLLGIEHPVLQGALGGLGGPELAAAVSNAGGLGMIGCGREELDWIRDQVRQVKKLTDKPFGVNVMIRRPDHDLYPLFRGTIEYLVQERPAVVATGAGDPRPVIPVLREAGMKAMPVTATVIHAIRAEQAGARIPRPRS